MTPPPRAYLSVTNGEWSLIVGGSPACYHTTEDRARSTAKRFKCDLSHGRIWNGDAGAWVPDPTVRP